MTKLVTVCNPLLDVTAFIEPEFLEKWGLEKNNAILAEEKHKNLIKEVQAEFKVEYSAGGSGQNTTRVAQWLLQEQGATTFIGSTHNDANEKIMREEAKKVGVNVEYYNGSELPTGSCCVLVNGANRSMVTYLEASSVYDMDHLKSEKVWKQVEESKVIYVTGFFHTVSTETILYLAKYAQETGKTFAMNLSAPFLLFVPPFFESFKKIQPYVDYYFGNETEFDVLAKAFGWEYKELSEVCTKLVQLRESEKTRSVVMTQGALPAFVLQGNQKEITYNKSFDVIKVKDSEICDTTGCGDAYVAGFLAGLTRDAPVEECVAAANYAAHVVIQRLGCAYPEKPEFKWTTKSDEDKIFEDINVQDAATKRGCLCW